MNFVAPCDFDARLFVRHKHVSPEKVKGRLVIIQPTNLNPNPTQPRVGSASKRYEMTRGKRCTTASVVSLYSSGVRYYKEHNVKFYVTILLVVYLLIASILAQKNSTQPRSNP